MKIIKKEMLVAIFLLLNLFIARSYAQPASGTGCCGPCGEVIMNAANLPSDASSVNPYINYVATANAANRCCGYFSGFYLGAGYGLGLIDDRLKIAGFAEPPPEPDLGRRRHRRHRRNSHVYSTTIFDVGFNLVLNYFLLGVEVGYDYRSRTSPVNRGNFEIPDSSTRFDIASRHALTADLLPGFVYDRFTGYLRLGFEQTSFSFHRRLNFPLGPDFTITDNDPLLNVSRKPTTNGYRAGVGFGVAAGRHVSFHLNYIHTFYNKMTFTPDLLVSRGPIVKFVEFSNAITIEPQRDEVNFTVRFRF